MVKVVFRKVDGRKRTRRNVIAQTRVRDASGHVVSYFTIDAKSPTFDDDLTRIYKSNVSKARSENKRLFGNPDSAGRFINRTK